jgi:hypothetical protein
MKQTKTAIIFLVICTLFTGCYDPLNEDLPLILGVNGVVIKNTKTISDCSFINEGILIRIYELSDATVEEFIHNTNKTLPINKDTTWANFGWYITPIDSRYKGVFDHLNAMSTTNIEKTLQTIKNELKKDNVFCSFYIRIFDEMIEPLEVQIFVLNPTTKILYMVESIT